MNSTTPCNLLPQLQSMNLDNLSIVLISTTAKKMGENRLLPSHHIDGRDCLNLILNDAATAKLIIAYLDNFTEHFFIDVERKQEINLWDIAHSRVKKALILPYKPNDITREAAYFLLMQYFNYNPQGMNVLVYGSGNIAAKLALYLAENEIHVSLAGRNHNKLQLLQTALNAILPAHSSTPITLHDTSKKYHALITAVSVENCIDEAFVSQLQPNALVIDIGINNVTAEFLKKARENSIRVFRLDVRIGSPFIEAAFSAYRTAFLAKHAGAMDIRGVACVAGGVVGSMGSLILDHIGMPKRILGIANGTGGVIKRDDYTEQNIENVKKIEAIL